ncbi:MAG: BatD family protein, partial [Victivallaceae bacterium]|nr:BatD family protein [Victivallaceae bacterium]
MRNFTTLHSDDTAKSPADRFQMDSGKGSESVFSARLQAAGRHAARVGNAVHSTIAAAFLFCALQWTTTGAEIRVSLEPPESFVGERMQLVVEAVGANTPPRIVTYPKIDLVSVERNSISTRMSIINGEATSSTAVALRCNRPGTFVVPPFKVRVGTQEFTTQELQGKIAPAAIRQNSSPQTNANSDEAADSSERAETIPLQEALFGTVKLADERKNYYLGENIPLVFELNLLRSLQIGKIQFPALANDKVILREIPGGRGKQKRYFSEPTESVREINGKKYSVLNFRCTVTPLSVGPLDLNAVSQVGVIQPRKTARSRNDPFDDPFFGGFFGNRNPMQTYQVAFLGEGLPNVIPLPPPPADAFFLGAVGSWQVGFALTNPNGKIGEISTFEIILTGTEVPEQLKAPTLENPDLRIYKPEIRPFPSSDGARIVYSIIPLVKGEIPVTTAVSIFDPTTGEYRVFRTKKILRAAANPLAGNRNVVLDAAPLPGKQSELDTQVQNTPMADSIEYLYPEAPASATVFPSWSNQLAWLLLVLLGAPLCFFGIEFGIKYSAARRKDESGNRRRRAAAKRKELLEQLSKATPEELPEFINSRLLPFLADFYNLPPGITPTELTAALPDPELGKAIAELGNAGFLPESERKALPERKELLTRTLRKLLLWSILALTPLMTLGSDAPDLASPGRKAYDKGDFSGAVSYYRQQLEKRGLDPYLLYNLGTSFLASGDNPWAYYYLEKAARLAPRDARIVSNRNLAKRRLGFSEEVTPSTMLRDLRDYFRPDEYLMLAAAAYLAFFIILLLRGRFEKHMIAIEVSILIL